MEELPAQDAAESLDHRSEYLSREPQYAQDSDMEQGLPEGKAKATLVQESEGNMEGMLGLVAERPVTPRRWRPLRGGLEGRGHM